jgi:hypothetical protein
MNAAPWKDEAFREVARVKVERLRATRQQRERSQQEQESRRRKQDEERRQKTIAALTPHYIAALLAVSTSNGLDQIEAFTFDVLAGLGLLSRPKGSKAKTDWRLTGEGQTALGPTQPSLADRAPQ